MPDISTLWVPATGYGDWAVAGPDLASGDDLATAVLISLFTDRRAETDDVIPDGSGDPRGWWGDLGRARPLGSRLWLLERAKQTEAVRLAAQDFCEAALAWLVEDGVAASVTVVTAWQRPAFLAIDVRIDQPDGSVRDFTYQWAWKDVT